MISFDLQFKFGILGWVTSYNVLIFYGMNIQNNQLF